MNERPTPLTDAAYQACMDADGEPYADPELEMMTDLARQLERERDEARERVDECIQLRKERDELREALSFFLEDYLEAVYSGDWGNWDPETEDCVIKARKALSNTAPKGEDEQ